MKYLVGGHQGRVNVRIAPDIGSEAIGSLATGDAVEVVGVEGSWARVLPMVGGTPLKGPTDDLLPMNWYMYAALLIPPVKPVPPPVRGPVLVGGNVIYNGAAAQLLLAHQPAMVSITFNPAMAREIKIANPGLRVMARAMIRSNPPSPEEWYDRLSAAFCEDMFLLGLNEQDVAGFGTGVQAIKDRIKFDTIMYQKIKDNRQYHMTYAGCGFSTGEPNIVVLEICEAMRGYRELIQDGMWCNQHDYATSDGRTGQTADGIRKIIFEEQTVDIPFRGYFDGKWVDGVVHRIPQWQWTIGRWIFYYQRCGWDPLSLGKVITDETGLDVGGLGGWKAFNAPVSEVVAWVRQYVVLMGRNIVVNGIEYPPPFVGGAIFQIGDPNGWGSYDLTPYLEGLQACNWGQA